MLNLLMQGFFMILQVKGKGSFPKTLSPDEEKHYLTLLEYGSDEEKEIAKNVLSQRNLRLVAHIVKKFSHKDSEDLISVGTIGLIKGIASFKSNKGTKLATYVARCIENAILTQRTFWRVKLEKVYLFKKNGAYFAA